MSSSAPAMGLDRQEAGRGDLRVMRTGQHSEPALGAVPRSADAPNCLASVVELLRGISEQAAPEAVRNIPTDGVPEL